MPELNTEQFAQRTAEELFQESKEKFGNFLSPENYDKLNNPLYVSVITAMARYLIADSLGHHDVNSAAAIVDCITKHGVLTNNMALIEQRQTTNESLQSIVSNPDNQVFDEFIQRLQNYGIEIEPGTKSITFSEEQLSVDISGDHNTQP